MTARERQPANASWSLELLDADSWLEIPEFGVAPADVDFRGFAFPLPTQEGDLRVARMLSRTMVRAARAVVQKRFASLADTVAADRDLLGLADESIMEPAAIEAAGLPPQFVCAVLYRRMVESLKMALDSGSDFADRLAMMADAGLQLTMLMQADALLGEDDASAATSAALQRMAQGPGPGWGPGGAPG